MKGQIEKRGEGFRRLRSCACVAWTCIALMLGCTSATQSPGAAVEGIGPTHGAAQRATPDEDAYSLCTSTPECASGRAEACKYFALRLLLGEAEALECIHSYSECALYAPEVQGACMDTIAEIYLERATAKLRELGRHARALELVCDAWVERGARVEEEAAGRCMEAAAEGVWVLPGNGDLPMEQGERQ